MIYIGDFQNNCIYGTLNNQLIKVKTVDDAVFIKCEVSIECNGEVWSHTFESPFYNSVAELYVSNFVHSFMSQQFQLPTSLHEISLIYSALAKVTIEVNEHSSEAVLDSTEFNFFMLAGSIEPIPMLSINENQRVLLPVSQSLVLDKKSTICFSYLSSTPPIELQFFEGDKSGKITLDFNTSELYCQTLIVPVEKIYQAGVDSHSKGFDSYNLELRFEEGESLSFGELAMSDNYIDFHQVLYQNEFGLVSVADFLGYAERNEEFKTQIQEFIANRSSMLSEIDKSESYPIELNTGYIWDAKKHEMLKSLIRSFNKYFLLNEDFIPIVNDGVQKIKPYSTNNYQQEETLKFKIASNDHSANRIF